MIEYVGQLHGPTLLPFLHEHLEDQPEKQWFLKYREEGEEKKAGTRHCVLI
jgi:hypothetical protein